MGTRGAWARDFLIALGNPNPNAKVIALVSSWTKAEFGPNTKAAAYNPLATTLDYGDNTQFNSAGVRNYKDRRTGIAASVASFGPTNAAIKRGLVANDAEAALVAMKRSQWGTNFGTVETFYRTQHTEIEPLPSEDNTPRNNEKPAPDTGKGDRTPIHTQSLEDINTDDVRKFLYVYLGVTFILLGVVLLVIEVGRKPITQAVISAVK